MVGVVVVTHCHLAEEMICAAQLVVGEELKQFQPVSIDPKEGSEEIREKIIAAIRKADLGKGILILTDMYGGTPSNISLSFLEEKKIEVITGVNLPMLIRAAAARSTRTASTEPRFPARIRSSSASAAKHRSSGSEIPSSARGISCR